MSSQTGALTHLYAGMALPFGGDRITHVDSALAAAFRPGDALVICQSDGQLLHIRADVRHVVSDSVAKAVAAFIKLREAPSERAIRFFDAFAERLGDEETWNAIERHNEADMQRAISRGRGVRRLELNGGARQAMIEGLQTWAYAALQPDLTLASVDHGSWSVDALRAPVGTVGFVFEGRPNVLVDACGVLASGNTAVLRIGDDAARTADAILRLALRPALKTAGLPQAAVNLLPPLGREAAWAMFTDRRLALAVARGSGAAVRLLGDLASQSGLPVSLHGVGGAWLVADVSADAERFKAVIESSLDRKVCNTLNTCCIVRSRAHDLVPAMIESLRSAARRLGRIGRLHVLKGSERYVDPALFGMDSSVDREGIDTNEPFATSLSTERLGTEWEWERTPEVTLVVVDDLPNGVELMNRHSPKFVASLIAEDRAAQDAFYKSADAAFVGDGFTRWVDGQYALNEPELGLANWEFGRPLGRASVLTGASVHTVRMRMRQTDAELRR